MKLSVSKLFSEKRRWIWIGIGAGMHLFACQREAPASPTDSAISINDTGESRDSLQAGVRAGDTNAYLRLRIQYMDYPSENFLFWAMLMANQHDYTEACQDVFFYTVTAYTGDLERIGEMDPRTREWALSYLKVAVERKHAGALADWEQVRKMGWVK